jgi:uncharacterized protein (PEP-CTERM system associated)
MNNRSASSPSALRTSALVGTALGLIAAWPAAAQERATTVSSGITLEQRYTDNINLDPEGFEESSFITSVTPFLGIAVDRRRVQGNLFLSGSVDYRTHDDSFKLRPNTTARANVEVLDELAFVEVAGAVTRERDDENRRFGGAPGTGLRDTRTTAFWSVTPSLRGRLGRLLEGNLSFRRSNYYVSGSSQAGDGFNNLYAAEVSTGPTFSRFTARAIAEKERGRSEGGRPGGVGSGRGNIDRETIALEPRFQVTRQFALIGRVGYENIDTRERRLDSEGLVWNAGFNWRPGARTDLSVRYGRRFERDNFDLRLTYRLTPTITVFGRVEDRQESQTLSFIRDLLDQTRNPTGADVIDPITGLPQLPDRSGDVIGDDIVDERIYEVSAVGRRGRHSLSASQRYRERKRQTGALALNDTWTTTLGWRYALSPRLSTGVSGSFQQENRPGLSPDSNTLSTNLNISYTVSPRTSFAASAQRSWRNSDVRLGNYTQNTIALSATVRF